METSLSDEKTSPIDPKLISRLEEQASVVARDLNAMLRNLQTQMFEASNLTCASFNVYDQTISNYGAAIKEASEKTTEFLNMCESLDKEFVNVYALAAQMYENFQFFPQVKS